MKVMCINGRGWIHHIDKSENKLGPEYGDVDVVIDIMIEDGMKGYVLGRFPYDCFLCSAFIPISDISETEMQRSYNFKTEEV